MNSTKKNNSDTHCSHIETDLIKSFHVDDNVGFRCPHSEQSCLYIDTCGMSVDKDCSECRINKPPRPIKPHKTKMRLLVLFLILALTSYKTFNIHNPNPYYSPEYLSYLASVERWECLYWSIVYVESEGNPLAVGKMGDGGLLQILPKGSGGYLDEANRILGWDKFKNGDRFSPGLTREIWEVVMSYHNPTKSLKKAIKMHNPRAGKSYEEKVMKKYRELIGQPN